MKNNLTLLATLLMCLCMTPESMMGQDIIILKDGEKIKAKIKEVNDNEIKYYEYADQGGILFSLDRSTVREVRYEFGKKQKEVDPATKEIYFVDDRNQNIKVNFSALGNATTVLTYERALNPFSSFEVSGKVNGLGINNDDDKSGFGVNAGYKIKLGSIVKKSDEYRPKHLLHGTYLRPNVGFNYVNVGNEFRRAESYNYVNFGIDIGRQWVLQNTLVLDVYWGLHYYGGSLTERADRGDSLDAIDIEDGDFFGTDNVASAVGIRIGFLFGKNKNKQR